MLGTPPCAPASLSWYPAQWPSGLRSLCEEGSCRCSAGTAGGRTAWTSSTSQQDPPPTYCHPGRTATKTAVLKLQGAEAPEGLQRDLGPIRAALGGPGVRPGNLHFQQVPSSCPGCWPGAHRTQEPAPTRGNVQLKHGADRAQGPVTLTSRFPGSPESSSHPPPRRSPSRSIENGAEGLRGW